MGFLSLAMMNHTEASDFCPANQSMGLCRRNPAIWPRFRYADPLFRSKVLDVSHKQGVVRDAGKILKKVPLEMRSQK
jgi:hypothetical protein